MNKRALRNLTELIGAAAVAIVLGWLSLILSQSQPAYAWAIVSLLPLIWLTLRHGSPSGIIGAALAGLALAGIDQAGTQWVRGLVLWLIPLLSVGLAGFFSKYTQKTLNNRRYSSTYLNIFTAVLLVVLVFTLLREVLLPPLLSLAAPFVPGNLNLWLSILVGFMLIGVILAIGGKRQPAFLIPKRSKYLSRKETSSLLND